MTAVATKRIAKKLAICMGTGAPVRVDALLTRQNVDVEASSRRDFRAGSIGWVGDVVLPEVGNALLFTGLPTNGPDLATVNNADDASRRLREFDGAFIAVFWDDTAGKMVLVTDFLGLQPIYMRRHDGGVEFATETKAFTASPNLAGWGAFISMGHTIAQQTLLDDVQRLPAAAVVTYDTTTGALKIDRHWDWPRGPGCSTRDVVEAFQASAVEYQNLGGPATLMLSGGFDSRLLLYALRGVNIRPDALIVAHQDQARDTDGRLGKTLARRERLAFRYVTPEPDFFSSVDFLRYVDACDAAIPTMGLFITKLLAQVSGGAVWDGLIPGFALRMVFQPGGGFDGYIKQQCRGWDDPHWQVTRILFGEETARAMHTSFQAALREEASRFSDDDTGIFRFIAENRIRHRTSSSPLKVLGQQTLPYVPGMTKAFFELISDLPRHLDAPNSFYLRIFEECFPEALQIPLLKGNEMFRVNGGRWEALRYRALERCEQFFGLHPSVDPSRYLARIRADTLPGDSSFLVANAALFEAGDWLDVDAARAIGPKHPLYGRLRVLLFHWKAWQWVHERRLTSTLAGSIR